MGTLEHGRCRNPELLLPAAAFGGGAWAAMLTGVAALFFEILTPSVLCEGEGTLFKHKHASYTAEFGFVFVRES